MFEEVPRVATHWTRAELLDAFAKAWRFVVGSEPSHIALACLWGMATLECGREGAACWCRNVGNLRGASPAGKYCILAGAYECASGTPPAGSLPWTGYSACAPGDTPYLPPASAQQFRAYDTFADGCTDKLALLAHRWPAAIAVLKTATSANDARAFVAALVAPGGPKYFLGDPSSYMSGVASLAAECLRTTTAADWPEPSVVMPAPAEPPVTKPDTPQSMRPPTVDADDGTAVTPLRAGEGEHEVELDEPEFGS